ncbi:MAG: HdaA/DnaA family protein [Alphaproteobacteria bacterium]
MKSAQQLPLDLVSRPALGREDFLIGACNKAAVGWIDAWPEWPAPVLVIQGPASSGKTHLAAVWRERAEAENLPLEFLARNTAEELAAYGRNLVLDGLDLWLGDMAAETTLFHLYNIFKEDKRSLLITTRMAPQNTDYALADLSSRLRAAPAVAIREPDDELLASVLIKLFSDRQLIITADIIRYILPRMERSFEAAQAIATQADRLALSQKKPVTIALVRQVLAGLQDS